MLRVCEREAIGADEEFPGLDTHGAELLRGHPGVVGEPTMDLVHALCIDDQQHADAPLFAAGKRTAEEDEALLSERDS